MNVTSRIEDVTAGAEILAADSTVQSLQESFRMGQSRTISVKGIDETILVHQILGTAP